MAEENDSNAAGPVTQKRRVSRRANILSAVAAVLVVALGAVGVMWFADASQPKQVAESPSPSPTTSKKSSKPKPKPSPKSTAKPKSHVPTLAELTESTTHTKLSDTPSDPAPDARNNGEVVRPKEMIPIHAQPKGKRIGKVGPKQIGDTWLPVIGDSKGWLQVLLPSKPNSSTGWIQASEVEQKRTPYLINVHLKSFRMELFKNDELVGDWKISPGAPKTPTPTGRTFVLGSMVDPKQKYSPIILPLGSHSATLNSFGGGPGTVAIHTWPNPDKILGKALSQGCIRVGKKELEKLTEVPLGTLVLVDNQ